MTYFCPRLDQPRGWSGRNLLTHVPGHEIFIPTKFRKHPSSSSVVNADCVFLYIYMHKCNPTPSLHLNEYSHKKFIRILKAFKSLTHVRGHEFFIPTKFHKADNMFHYRYISSAPPPPFPSPKLIHNKFIKILKALKSFILIFFHLQIWKLSKINVDLTLYGIQIYRNCIKMRQND